jgi:hypothetical protein
LSNADNDALQECFEKIPDTNKHICIHCKVFKVLVKNSTKRMQHIASCPVFKNKCKNNEDGLDQSLQAFRDRVLLACEGYARNTQAMELSRKSPPFLYVYLHKIENIHVCAAPPSNSLMICPLLSQLLSSCTEFYLVPP